MAQGVAKVHYEFGQRQRRRLTVRGRDVPFWIPAFPQIIQPPAGLSPAGGYRPGLQVGSDDPYSDGYSDIY